jgi:hypothetical protein
MGRAFLSFGLLAAAFKAMMWSRTAGGMVHETVRPRDAMSS